MNIKQKILDEFLGEYDKTLISIHPESDLKPEILKEWLSEKIDEIEDEIEKEVLKCLPMSLDKYNSSFSDRNLKFSNGWNECKRITINNIKKLFKE